MEISRIITNTSVKVLKATCPLKADTQVMITVAIPAPSNMPARLECTKSITIYTHHILAKSFAKYESLRPLTFCCPDCRVPTAWMGWLGSHPIQAYAVSYIAQILDFLPE